MKKLFYAFMMLVALLLLAACAKKEKIIHCDGCGKELHYAASDDVTEEWIILCSECRKKLQTTE